MRKEQQLLNSECYMNMLETLLPNFVRGHREWWFQQDGATAHTARISTAILRACRRVDRQGLRRMLPEPIPHLQVYEPNEDVLVAWYSLLTPLYAILCPQYQVFKDVDVAAQAITFFGDGFETSSAAMSFILYCLALNPDVQTRVREEVCDVLQKHGGKLTFDNIQEMTYLDMVFHGLFGVDGISWKERFPTVLSERTTSFINIVRSKNVHNDVAIQELRNRFVSLGASGVPSHIYLLNSMTYFCHVF
ncbi:hypothetical protein ANN_24473 [Periplaneta americana]|uniref:Cytochrome P450 n=1 Tax=Periplaneta americana TaxID=6978 RepID=A0ABQ8S3H9_PERAM|nr:hypothetical protein ANN_24473 [Periplaneta americana]